MDLLFHTYIDSIKYGYQPITKENIDVNSIKITSDVKILDTIWNSMVTMCNYLGVLTQRRPWILAREGLPSGITSKRIIDTNLMKDFYSKLLERVQNEEKKSK